MPLHIFANTLPMPETKKSIQDLVIATIGNRPGDWTISILAEQKSDGWKIEIDGPNKFNWSHIFYQDDHDPKIIKATIEKALPKADASSPKKA